jgi:hypothetical protein
MYSKVSLKSALPLLGILILVFNNGMQAQDKAYEKGLVQLSGVVSSKRIGSIPFATIKVRNSYQGTYAAFDGFYSLVVKEHDTVEYTAVGFKKAIFIIPGNASDHKFINSPELETDTLSFQGPVVGPRMSYEEFKTAFLNLRLGDGYAENARKNLDPEVLSQLYETLARDGGENQQIAMQNFMNSYYYSGYQTNYNMMGNNSTPVPASLMNPFAWAQFFQAIKDGKYKKKEKKNNKYDF